MKKIALRVELDLAQSVGLEHALLPCRSRGAFSMDSDKTSWETDSHSECPHHSKGLPPTNSLTISISHTAGNRKGIVMRLRKMSPGGRWPQQKLHHSGFMNPQEKITLVNSFQSKIIAKAETMKKSYLVGFASDCKICLFSWKREQIWKWELFLEPCMYAFLLAA